MSKITKGEGGPPPPKAGEANIKHGVPAAAATEDSPGGYGGSDRLRSEAGPLEQGTEGQK
jgi:hypothetical protein